MNKLTGVLLIVIGASSYGVLATFVKKASLEGLDISGLSFLQYFIGFVVLSSFSLIKVPKKQSVSRLKPSVNLILFGTTTGLTSYFYYLSIQYIPVSVGIILLMQTIWMGVVLEFLLTRKKDKSKFIGSIFVIIGTLFAVNVFHKELDLNIIGVFFGLLASLTYTVTLYASSSVSVELPNILRSKYLVLGGLLIVALLWNFRLFQNNDFLNVELWKYGIFLGFFGAILPPITFNKGFPIVGVGLGSILTSIEIPISILSAHFILHEQVKLIQWFGVFIIIISIVLINYKSLKSAENIKA